MNEPCPNGHTGVDRPTGGMPQPCNEPSCTYYRRPIATKVTGLSSEHWTERSDRELAPSPTGVDNLDILDEILYEIFGYKNSKGESVMSAMNFDKAAKTKAQLTSLINQIVRKELEDLVLGSGLFPIDRQYSRDQFYVVDKKDVDERLEFYRGKSNE